MSERLDALRIATDIAEDILGIVRSQLPGKIEVDVYGVSIEEEANDPTYAITLLVVDKR